MIYAVVTLDRPVDLLSKLCDKSPYEYRGEPGLCERLLPAAMDLTGTYGMSVRVDAIPNETDVAGRSRYQHFGGKDGLFVEVIRVTATED